EHAVLADQPRRHLRITVDALSRESFLLPVPRLLDPLPDFSRAFGALLFGEFADLDGRYVDVNVDAIKQRAGDLRDVTLDWRGRAFALAGRVIEIAARTRVHRRHEHEAGREGERHGSPANGHLLVFERLAEDL